VEKEKPHAKYHVRFPQAELSSEWASATRGAVDPRPGRLRQWGPLPRTPRPCANPVRASASAPSRREATAALAYRPCYLRNCVPSSFQVKKAASEARRKEKAVGSGRYTLGAGSVGGGGGGEHAPFDLPPVAWRQLFIFKLKQQRARGRGRARARTFCSFN
jgi:hypothetical protein